MRARTNFPRRAIVCAFFLASWMTAGFAAAAPSPVEPEVRTATTHPMKYYVSLPKDWSAERTWPVLVAPSAHYGDKGRNLAAFAAERDRRKAAFIIVAPFVINADRTAGMPEYRGAVVDAINAADAAANGRDEVARARFDSEGIRAVLADVRRLFRGEDKVYITGFSSSTHVAYLFLFNHPELLKGVIINSGVYLGRGVDEEQLPFLNPPERASLPVKYIIGEEDQGFERCLENWRETKARLLRCGHQDARIEMEIIRKGNRENLNPGTASIPRASLTFVPPLKGLLGTEPQNAAGLRFLPINGQCPTLKQAPKHAVQIHPTRMGWNSRQAAGSTLVR
jgi:predicted esterase